ncbi:MAG: SAM-dependent methyltransferase [Bacteroidales bacterium]|nr:SAM-dependent methyltransferase [Bacteroidales bacterium]
MKGKLFLIPVGLGGENLSEVLPESLFSTLQTISVYVVEESRTARRFLSAAGLRGRIDSLTFYELNEHSNDQVLSNYIKVLEEGTDIGLMSEAGLPAVADPGAALVAAAHLHNIDIVPFVGPSSLMLALMSSGMNGQCFAFEGYLPVKSDQRRIAIKKLEQQALKGRTELFIETPYRNDSLLADILEVCGGNTRLCIAADITLPTQMIKSVSISEWKSLKLKGFEVGKRPAVFILGR